MIGSLSNDVFNDARKTGSSFFAFSRHDFDSFFAAKSSLRELRHLAIQIW